MSRAGQDAIAHALARLRYGDDYVGEFSAHETVDAAVALDALRSLPVEQRMEAMGMRRRYVGDGWAWEEVR